MPQVLQNKESVIFRERVDIWGYYVINYYDAFELVNYKTKFHSSNKNNIDISQMWSFLYMVSNFNISMQAMQGNIKPAKRVTFHWEFQKHDTKSTFDL